MVAVVVASVRHGDEGRLIDGIGEYCNEMAIDGCER